MSRCHLPPSLGMHIPTHTYSHKDIVLHLSLCLMSSSGEPSPPAVHGQRDMGRAYRLGLVKQDDGGMPIVEYIVKYKTVSDLFTIKHSCCLQVSHDSPTISSLYKWQVQFDTLIPSLMYPCSGHSHPHLMRKVNKRRHI